MVSTGEIDGTVFLRQVGLVVADELLPPRRCGRRAGCDDACIFDNVTFLLVPAPIPTLSPVGLVTLAAFLAFVALTFLRRRRAR